MSLGTPPTLCTEGVGYPTPSPLPAYTDHDPTFAYNPFLAGLMNGLEPIENLSISEWADKYRQLPKTSSAEYGKFRTSRTPYNKEVMDCLSPQSPVKEVCYVKPTQIGGTDGVGNNKLLHTAHKNPGPCLMILPTIELARRHSKSKIDPSVKAMDCMRGLIRNAQGDKKQGDSILIKEFPGGFWMFLGGNSAGALRSVSIRDLIIDDLDGMELEVGEEGDPVEIIKKRTDSFSASSKILYISTPTSTENSRIWKIYKSFDQCKYHVPCPFCSHMQELVWGGPDSDFGLKWADHDPDTAKYMCGHCHKLIPETKKTWMLNNGIWVPLHPEITKFRSFQLSSLYSPYGWVSWSKMVDEWLKSNKDVRKRKVFVNTRLGLPFEEKGTQPQWKELKALASLYDVWEAPIGVGLVTGGVDVQPNRLAVLLRGWGKGEESWLIYWTEIFGDTNTDDPWDQLETLFYHPIMHKFGFPIPISCIAVDSGNQTHTVYNFVRRRPTRYIATKGMSTPNNPILGRPSKQDVSYKGSIIKSGVELWPVGADTAKSTIYGRFESTIADPQPGPGRYHFPMSLPDDYYRQITSEKHITKYKKDGFAKKEWFLPSGNRNEALDCEVLALAAALKCGILHLDWAKLYYNQHSRQEAQSTGKSTLYPSTQPNPKSASSPANLQGRSRVSSRYMSR